MQQLKQSAALFSSPLLRYPQLSAGGCKQDGGGEQEPQAKEIVRVWATNAGQVFSVRLERWDDPTA